MNNKLRFLIYYAIATFGFILLFSIYDGAKTYEKTYEVKNKIVNKSNYLNKSNNVYYFWNGTEYIKADSQKFRIIFTGEVVNAYFTIGNKEYSTLNYYKQINNN